MAGGKEYSSYQRGIIDRYYQNIDTITIGKLSELVSELYVCTDAKKAGTHWKNVQLALKKTPADPMRVGKIVNTRDVKLLAELVNQLSTMKPGDIKKPAPSALPSMPAAQPSDHAAASGAPAADAAPVSANDSAQTLAPAVPAAPREETISQRAAREPTHPDVVRAAFTAFKKRIKVTRLDAESKISNRALTAGRSSGIIGIIPPREFPQATWDELVTQGRIKRKGQGFYDMP